MNPRRDAILEYLERFGTASYDVLAQKLEVSTMTIRRDCDELAGQSRLIKALGGVQRADAPSYLYDNGVRASLSENRMEKRAIAREALKLVGSQATLYLDPGTTCLEFAKLLARERTGLTVVTNSALACLEMSRGENTVVGLGGEYYAPSFAFVGPQAQDAAKSTFVDIAFISTKAFVPKEGTFESSIGVYRIKQIVARNAGKVVLLVDHSKFGRRALSKVIEISAIHHVVTDEKAPAAHLATLRRLGRTVSVAPLSPVAVSGHPA